MSGSGIRDTWGMRSSLLGWCWGVTRGVTLTGGAGHGGLGGLGFVMGQPWKGFPDVNDDDNSLRCLDTNFVLSVSQELSHLILIKALEMVLLTIVPSLQMRKQRALVLVADLRSKGKWREHWICRQETEVQVPPE